jgi:heme oxygenase
VAIRGRPKYGKFMPHVLSIGNPPLVAAGGTPADDCRRSEREQGASSIERIKSDSLGLLHRTLRASTRMDHLTIDRMMLRLNLARREDYGLFLNIHYGALRELEPGWRVEDRNDFRVMTHCLQTDLHALRIATKTITTKTSFLTDCNRLGLAYVIRGSRLGSSFLRRRVPSELEMSYLDFVPTLSWAQFLHQLKVTSQTPECDTREVIDGAQFAFDVFGDLTTQALA